MLKSTFIIVCVSAGARLLSSCGVLVLSSSIKLSTVSPHFSVIWVVIWMI